MHRRLRPQELLIGRVAARETPADGGVQRFQRFQPRKMKGISWIFVGINIWYYMKLYELYGISWMLGNLNGII